MTIYKKVAQKSQIPPGSTLEVTVGSQMILILNIKGKFYAIDNHCPHKGAPLGDGPLRGDVLTCTWHGWDFDVPKGCHVEDPDVCLKQFPVQIKKNAVYVGIKK